MNVIEILILDKIMDVLVALSLFSTGLLWGASLYFQRVMEKRELSLREMVEGLNKNLSEFSKAYADFQSKCQILEQRLASVEFKVTGVMQTHEKAVRR